MRRATAFLVLFLAVQLAVPFAGNVTRADSGKWTRINNGLIFEEVDSILVDPQHSDTIYAGTGGFEETGDIYKSSDGGATWKATNATDRGSGNVTEIGFILVDPSNTSVVFARTFSSSSTFSSRWSLLKSTDAGLTWKEVNNGLPTDEALLCLAIDPANASRVRRNQQRPVQVKRRRNIVDENQRRPESWWGTFPPDRPNHDLCHLWVGLSWCVHVRRWKSDRWCWCVQINRWRPNVGSKRRHNR